MGITGLIQDISFFLSLVLRKVVAFIDGWIYTADAELYDLITRIARQEIFSKGVLSEVAGRVYQLLALIMIFRLIFLFITYVVNPDDMADKGKGPQNVVKKMIITLLLIIVTPWAFEQARAIQQVVLEEGVIEYFVFGQSDANSASSGYEFMHTVGKLFVIPYQCQNAECTSEKGLEPKECPSNSKWDENIGVNSADGGGCLDDGTCQNFCGYGMGDEADRNYAKTLFKASYPNGAKYDLRSLMLLGGAGRSETNSYYAEYKFPFIGTTLIGVVIGYMLIVMCIDIAVRSIKLSFYELIAPIPIVSYIGPKDGKDAMLSKWFTQVLKTYADLFTRIAGLEIAVFFIDTLLENETFVGRGDFFVEVFLIIGALTFAKKLPDILKDLGVDFKGGTFNLKKKLNDEMLGSKLIKRAGAAGLAFGGGAVANTMRWASNQYKRQQDIEKEAAAAGLSVKDYRKTADFKSWRKTHREDYGSNAIAGAFSAAARAATTKDGKLIAGAMEGVKGAVEKRDLRDKRKDANYRIYHRAADAVRGWAGIDKYAKSKADGLREELSNLNAQAYAAQNGVSASQQQLMALGVSQDAAKKWYDKKRSEEANGRTFSLPPGTSQDIIDEFNRYATYMENNAATRVKIAKTEKKLNIYEREKK